MLEDAFSSSVPLSQSRSEEKDLDAEAVVTARRSHWSRVTETEELMGVFSWILALPQYLMQAMLVGAETVAMWIVGEILSLVTMITLFLARLEFVKDRICER